MTLQDENVLAFMVTVIMKGMITMVEDTIIKMVLTPAWWFCTGTGREWRAARAKMGVTDTRELLRLTLEHFELARLN